TANGRTYAAKVVLDEIRIGGIVVRDVTALVVQDGLHISLLGMTFLGELQRVEATPTQLILRR
ncbi:MAG: TIGR02281 family clan AA aspartic protease, partial [Pseudomonadota bacterium]